MTIATGTLGPFWGRPGVLWRSPGSGSVGPTEAIPAAISEGFMWHAFDFRTGEWKDERKIVLAHGGDVVVWSRIMGLGQLQDLSTAAIRWAPSGAPMLPIAPNIEIGDGGAGSTRDALLMQQTLTAMSHAGKALLITDGWADPLGRWVGYRRWAGSVECFPEVNRALVDTDGCLLHADAFFRATTPMFGAYGTGWKGRKPVIADYRRQAGSFPGTTGAPFVVFCGDDVEDWKLWKP